MAGREKLIKKREKEFNGLINVTLSLASSYGFITTM